MPIGTDFELTIVAETSLDAIKAVERLFKDFDFKELKISNDYDFKKNNVYTIKIHANKLGQKKEN